MDEHGIRTYRLPIFKREDTIRKSFTLPKKTADRWKSFVARYPEKTAILDYALNRFMDECEAGTVGFEIDLGGDDDGEKG